MAGKHLAAALAVLLFALPAQAAPDMPEPAAPAASEAAARKEIVRTLVEAAREGKAELVAVLLDRGADPDAADEDGETPLLAAVMAERAAMANLLLDRGADPNLADADGWTPLHAAAGADDPTLAALLLDRGAKVDAVNASGLTPLMHAAMEDRAETLETLLKRGAQVSVAARNGGTALMFAAWDCCPGSVRKLLAAGAPQQDGAGGPFAVLTSGTDWYLFFGQLGRSEGRGASLRFYADVRDDETPLPMPKTAWASFDGSEPVELRWEPTRGDAGGCGGDFADPVGFLQRLAQTKRLVLRIDFTNGQTFSAEFRPDDSRDAIAAALAAAQREGWGGSQAIR